MQHLQKTQGGGPVMLNQPFRQTASLSYNRPAATGTAQTHMPRGRNNQTMVPESANDWWPVVSSVVERFGFSNSNCTRMALPSYFSARRARPGAPRARAQ